MQHKNPIYLVPDTCKNYTPDQKVPDEYLHIVYYSRSCMAYDLPNADNPGSQPFAACAIPEGGFPPLTGRYLSCGEYSYPKHSESHDKLVVCTFGIDQTTCPASTFI